MISRLSPPGTLILINGVGFGRVDYLFCLRPSVKEDSCGHATLGNGTKQEEVGAVCRLIIGNDKGSETPAAARGEKVRLLRGLNGIFGRWKTTVTGSRRGGCCYHGFLIHGSKVYLVRRNRESAENFSLILL